MGSATSNSVAVMLLVCSSSRHAVRRAAFVFLFMPGHGPLCAPMHARCDRCEQNSPLPCIPQSCRISVFWRGKVCFFKTKNNRLPYFKSLSTCTLFEGEAPDLLWDLSALDRRRTRCQLARKQGAPAVQRLSLVARGCAVTVFRSPPRRKVARKPKGNAEGGRG